MKTAAPGFAARLRRMADRKGWLPPWPQWWGEDETAKLLPDAAVLQSFTASCPRLPLAMLDEIYLPAPHGRAGPAGYLQVSDTYEREAATANELGWPVATVLSHHLALLTDPGMVRQVAGQGPALILSNGHPRSFDRHLTVVLDVRDRHKSPQAGSRGHSWRGLR